MSKFTVFDENGSVVRTGSCQRGLVQAQAGLAETVVEGKYPGHTYWFDAGAPTLRPTLALPTTHTIATATDWIMTSIPEGTTVLTDGEQVGAVGADETLTISFPDAGTWTLRLDPPFPHLPAECEVTVT